LFENKSFIIKREIVKLSVENWFVLQTINGKESAVELNINKLNLEKMKVFLPKRKIKIKKKNVINDRIIPLYPGYIFIIGFWDIEEAKKILSVNNAVNFVGGLSKPGIINKEEKELIKGITENSVVEYSKAVKEGNRIKIISGPLKQLEGVIVSVDRRKQRAVVNLPLLNTSIKVVLSFEYMEVSKENEDR
jgi:transcription termination/antitermination protein NusG